MPKKQVTADLYYDDSGEAYYVLPSGFENRFIVVNESPVELRVTHLSADQLKQIEENIE